MSHVQTASDPMELRELVTSTIRRLVAEANTLTEYREPLVAIAAADDPCFLELRRVAEPTHMMPQDPLAGARSVVSFFLPFAARVVEANAIDGEQVAQEWAQAYVETNALIGRITTQLIDALAERGVRAAAEPATHNFDPVSLTSRWSHKSVAVIAGLGSFGVHQMVITDAGCAGRFGSLVLDADVSTEPSAQASGPPGTPLEPKERCLYYYDGSCLECVLRCPIQALDPDGPLDKQRCWHRLVNIAAAFEQIGVADVCGKCAVGPCSFGSAVP
jgi:epoxyqueuosine reductase